MNGNNQSVTLSSPAAMRLNNRALIILGMHRSGTSALTGMLAQLGADSGASLEPAKEGVNPKGFWEHSGIVAIHDDVLRVFGSSWSDVRPLPDNWWRATEVVEQKQKIINVLMRDFADSPLWVLKDPRLCRLLPMWLEIFEELKCRPYFIICLRHPLEVARSLRARDKFVEERSCLLWLEHLLESEKWTRGYPRTSVNYDRLLSDWRVEARRVSEVLSLELTLDDNGVLSQVNGFIEPSLRHHSTALQGGADNTSILALATRCYELFMKSDLPDSLASDLAGIHHEVKAINKLIAPWADEIQMLESEIQPVKRQLADVEAEVKRVKSTFSWTITKPLRALYNQWRQVVR